MKFRYASRIVDEYRFELGAISKRRRYCESSAVRFKSKTFQFREAKLVSDNRHYWTLRPGGEGKSISLGGLGVEYKVLPEDTGGTLAVVEHPIDAGRLVRPHKHELEDEISYVVEGNIGMRIGEREFVAGPGSWVFKQRGIMHTFWNTGPGKARLIEIITPGAFAYYFSELADIISGGVPPDLKKLGELDHKYKIEYNMDWVPQLMAKHGLKKLVGDP